MPAIEAFAFDFDGTLAGIQEHTTARIQAFEHMAVAKGDERFMVPAHIHRDAHRHGTFPHQIIGWVLQQQGLVEQDVKLHEDALTIEMVREKTRIYNGLAAAGLEALPGAIGAVNWAANRFGPGRTAIVTTESMQVVRAYLARHDLLTAVGHIVSGDQVAVDQLKPDPYAYTLAAARMRTRPEACAAIEDSPRGLQAAKSAHYLTFAVTTTHDAEELMDNADYIVTSPDKIKDFFA